jgi:hypothetical protein
MDRVRKPITLFIICAALFPGGCSAWHKVQVVDQNGAPVAGAEVMAISPSFASGPNLTDRKGIAAVPYNIQGAQWITISKPGYVAVYAEVPACWPLHVTLTPEPAPGWMSSLVPPEGPPAPLPWIYLPAGRK